MKDTVIINEVGPRDGLQNQPKLLAVDEKLALIQALLAAQLRYIELGAFVSPKAVPAMSGTDQVVASCRDYQADFSVLVPNMKGYELARQASCKTVAMVVYATEGMAQKNVRMSRRQALDEALCMAAVSQTDNMQVLATIATSFECPFDGMADIGIVAETANELLENGIDAVVIADTIGAAAPSQVKQLVTRLAADNDVSRLACHFHDTRALGMANVFSALEAGIRRFDASIAGLGGCPFAPGASGNIATEDAVMMLEQMGLDTGVDLDQLLVASDLAEQLTGTAPGGRSKAWLKPYRLKQRELAQAS